MNKFSRTARSVTFAAIVGLSLGVSVPGAFAQTSVEAANPDQLLKSADSLINPATPAKLTIHKFADPTASPLPAPTGTAADAENPEGKGLGTKLDGVEFTIYKINKDLEGKPIDMKTNNGLAAAAAIFDKAGLYANDVDNLVKNGTLTAGKTEKTADGIAVFSVGTDHAPYLVIESAPLPGYSPANPFIAFVPMTAANAGSQQGTTWNYDVHAVPKNYKKPAPKKTVIDINDGKLDNAGSEIEYNIDTTVRKIEKGKRLKYYFIGDTLDKNNFDVTAQTTKITVLSAKAGADPREEDYSELASEDYTISLNKEDNAFRVNFTESGLKKLGSEQHVRVHVQALKNSDNPIAPNQATEWEPKYPNTDQDVEGGDTPPSNPEPDSGRKTEIVETRFGEVSFTKVDAKGVGLEGAEFSLYQTAPGQTCDAVDVKNPEKNAFKVTAQDAVAGTPEFEDTFKSGVNGAVKITGLHVNDFVNNKLVDEGEQTMYCLVETVAPKGKELLSKAVGFKLLKSSENKAVNVPVEVTEWEKSAAGEVNVTKKSELQTIQSPIYKPVTVTVGSQGEGKVVNLDDTTPQLPLTGGAGVGILAVIGAAIIGAGAWFARRNSAES
ncbi:isopeptide-forming domain-containing fimbrial protein [Corynebacterium diphtheriae]|nr:isopeptide-forming domain-containing fimbrial protein [Corynebacterium diphtheriae]